MASSSILIEINAFNHNLETYYAYIIMLVLWLWDRYLFIGQECIIIWIKEILKIHGAIKN
jgi:uncharacterized membrane protein